MARSLGVSPKQRSELREALAELERRGELVIGKKSRYRRPDTGGDSRAHVGRIEFSSDGKRKSGYFVPEDAESDRIFREMSRPRVFVPGHFAGTAMDGDTVEVHLVRRQPPKWHKHSKSHRGRDRDEGDRWQARVVRIVARSERRIVGTFHRGGSRASLSPEDSRLPPSFRLVEVLPDARPGDIVVAELVEWTDPHLPPLARMIEVLGRNDAPGVDMLKVIHKFGLPLAFPEAVLAEAERIPDTVTTEETDRREDWREREVFTIDPKDAKDFDDAICVTEHDDGTWELAVHIADVSHYVKPGTALDKEARKRGNSVYLADRVIPMLPEKLSNGVCSLKPDVERLTHAAILTFDQNGKETGVRFASALIRSQRRYSYEEAFARMTMSDADVEAIEDEKEKRFARHLKRAWKLASRIRSLRFRNGALDLDFPEIRVVLDDEGRAIGIEKSEYDESHQLIEEFMLVANEAVARETKNAPAPSVYRIHEDPDPGKLEEFADLARSFGHRVGDVTHRPELQKLLAAVRGTLEEQSIKIALLKSLKRAAYSKDSLGHYGLSKTNYTHFTSPIRRYADLAVHRVLKKIRSRHGDPTAPENPDRTPSVAEIGDFAAHISKTERVAAEAEQETRRLKIIEYLEHVLAEDPDAVFPATVHETRPIGAFVELDGLLVRGLIRKDDLPPQAGYYFDRVRGEFQPRRGGPVLGIGRTLDVRLLRVDRNRGFLDFVPA